MNQNIFQKKEEENTAVDTLSTNENIEESVENEENIDAAPEDVNLDSLAKPTAEQEEEAGIITDQAETIDAPEETVENVEATTSEDAPIDATSENGTEPMTEEQEAVETMITQSQVNEIVGRTRTETRDKTMANVYERYGVTNDNELDNLVGNAQKYETLHDAYTEAQNALKEANIKLAMVDSGIAPERYEDARLILQGKNLEITPETIKAELTTHPEWAKKVINDNAGNGSDIVSQTIAENSPAKKAFVKKGPSSVITALGNDKSETPAISEKEVAMGLFGLDR